MHFTSPNTDFLRQGGAFLAGPVKGFAPGPHQGPYIGWPGYHSGVLALRARCFSLQAITKSWKPWIMIKDFIIAM